MFQKDGRVGLWPIYMFVCMEVVFDDGWSGGLIWSISLGLSSIVFPVFPGLGPALVARAGIRTGGLS